MQLVSDLILRNRKKRLILGVTFVIICETVIISIWITQMNSQLWIIIISLIAGATVVTKIILNYRNELMKKKEKENTNSKEKSKDNYIVAYCINCGTNLTKKYSFCPKCGSCKVKN